MNWAIFVAGVVVGVLLKTLIVFTLHLLVGIGILVATCFVIVMLVAKVMSEGEESPGGG